MTSRSRVRIVPVCKVVKPFRNGIDERPHSYAKILLAEGIAINEIGYRINETPMSALVGADGEKYASPNQVFAYLADRIAKA